MAKYNRIEAPVRTAKEFNNIVESKRRGEENTLKSYDKLRRYNELYQEGLHLGKAGESIDNETSLVEENGKMIPKNTHRNFLAGYRDGLKYFQAESAKKNTGLGR